MVLFKVKTFIVALAVLFNLSIGFFVYFKNKSHPLNKNMGLVGVLCGLMCLGYAVNYLHLLHFHLTGIENNPLFTLYSARFTHIGCLTMSPWIVFFLLQMKTVSPRKLKVIKIVLYGSGLLLFALALTTDLVIKDLSLDHVIYDYSAVPGRLYFLMRWYFIIMLASGLFILRRLYVNTDNKIKQMQLKLLALGGGIFSIGSIVFAGLLPLLGIRSLTFLAAPLSIVFVAFNTYAIIRYRFLDIETVIHKTALWLLTSLLVFSPGIFFFYVLYPLLIKTGFIIFSIVTLVIFSLSLRYYRSMQPRINHWFRRKEYDYQGLLMEVSEKLTREIEIKSAMETLLHEVTKLMYIRNVIVYIQSVEEELKIGAFNGYPHAGEGINISGLPFAEELKSLQPQKYAELFQWLRVHPEILELHQVSVDPRYESIKKSSLELFKEIGVEIIIPIMMEQKLLGIVGLGKKENLKQYSVADLECLQKLSIGAGIGFFNALHHKDIVERERLAEEMELGQEIQMALLPKESPRVQGLKVIGMMEPAREIGGDYYDFIPINHSHRLGIVIGDVSGKGVAAGLLTSMIKTAIHIVSRQESSPKQVLWRTNQIVYEFIGGQRFVTLLYLEWDAQEKMMRYSSAGHEHIIIYRCKAKTSTPASVEVIPSGGVVLGVVPDIAEMIQDSQISLCAGDKVVIYTDGVTEARNDRDDFYTLERLARMVAEHGTKPVEELLAIVKNDVHDFIGSQPQFDDITIVMMEVE